jgi:hypothetical protein
MNKRIEELVKQAQEYAGQQIDEGANWDDAPIYYTEKLTELIVKECAGVCEDYRGTEWGKAAECIGDSIKEHFGVEE